VAAPAFADTDAGSFKPGGDVDAFAMQVLPVGNRVSDFDAHPKADAPLGRFASNSGMRDWTSTANRAAE
jgi:hypothetical protein